MATKHTFHFPSDTNTTHFKEECDKLGVELTAERAIFVMCETDDDRVLEVARELGALHYAEGETPL
jgi:hypothetical protein